jgi:arsenate reductase
MIIFHNPKCGKSRSAIKYLEDLNLKFDVRNYQKDPLSMEEIRDLLKKLNLNAIDIVRTKEKVWIELSEKEKKDEFSMIQAIIKHPILLERPIIIQEEKAFITRSQEKLELIK